MTDALDTLRPEVREAVQELDGKTYSGSRTHLLWQIIRAELLRLASKNFNLHEANAGLYARMERLERAEAELAAFKTRIAGSCPAHAVVDDREECGVRIWVDRSIGSNRTLLGELEGKRVRLVVESDDV